MKESSTISIVGPKAGVGKTILATNLAHALARQSRGKILLVDLDVQDCGDIGILLGISQAPSVADFVGRAHKLTPAALEREIHRHPDGVSLLPLTRKSRQISLLSPDKLAQVLQLCRQIYDFILIDCGSAIHPLVVKLSLIHI